ncbi:hypothetical protein lerEdw1_018130 [Lerista edwardsae]|nr:hypothetical protein lerEdw1_018130 [Lerista edwardsae]
MQSAVAYQSCSGEKERECLARSRSHAHTNRREGSGGSGVAVSPGPTDTEVAAPLQAAAHLEARSEPVPKKKPKQALPRLQQWQHRGLAELTNGLENGIEPTLSDLFVCLFVSRFGGDQPVYINIIRDPINRFLSNYFFRRFGDWRGEQNHMIRTPSMRQEERYLDINVCILENYPECSNPRLFYIIPYFCGQHPRCR